MKNLLFLATLSVALCASSVTSFAQSKTVLNSPSRSEMESTIDHMGLSLGQKISLRNTLTSLREQGEKVLGNQSLSDEQKTAKITKIRENALSATQKTLSASQQKQLKALLLPNQ